MEGLVQTWGGPLFFMQAQKGGSNNLGHGIKGGGGGGGVIIFYYYFFFMQSGWGQGVNLKFFCSHCHSSVNINMGFNNTSWSYV